VALATAALDASALIKTHGKAVACISACWRSHLLRLAVVAHSNLDELVPIKRRHTKLPGSEVYQWP